jgi:hypothetical protein
MYMVNTTSLTQPRHAAGISGALLAYYLANPEERYGDVPKGRTIVVLEGAEVASGASKQEFLRLAVLLYLADSWG